MPTKNLVPRADGEGKLGIKGASNLTWKEVNAVSGSFDELSNSAGNDLIAAGSGITITKISTSGSQYEISSSGASINSINDISDVDTATAPPTDGQALVWNNTDSEWQPGTISTTQFSNWSDVSGSIIPNNNSQYDLGSAEKKVRHLYLSNSSVRFGNEGELTAPFHLKFDSGSEKMQISTDDGANFLNIATENFATGQLSGYATESFVTSQGYSTETYVNTQINDAIQGLDAKESVVAATTGALSGYTYDGNTNQYTEDSASGALTIDDYALSDGGRILVKDQADGIQNGIYSVSNIDGASAVTLSRVDDLTDADADADDFDGAFVFVQNGTDNAGRSYVAKPTTLGETTVGTHAMSWVTFTSSTVTSLNNLSDVTYSNGELTFTGLDFLNLPDSGSISNGVLDLKNAGTAVSSIKLYCESNNAHFTELKSAPHAEYSGNVSFTLPATVGTSGQVLQTDGTSGVLTWVDAASGGGISSVQEDSSPVLGGPLDTNNQTIIGNIIPNSLNAVQSLGSSLNKWQNLHLWGYIKFNNFTISQSSSNPNILSLTGNSGDGRPEFMLQNGSTSTSEGPTFTINNASTTNNEVNSKIRTVINNGFNLFSSFEMKNTTIASAGTPLLPTQSRTDFSVVSNSIEASDSQTIALSIVGQSSSTRPFVRIADAFNLPTSDGTDGQVLSTNGSGVLTWANVASGGGISDIVEDSTPQLGGPLDVNNKSITTAHADGNIIIDPINDGNVLIGAVSGAEGTKTTPPEIRFYDETGFNGNYIGLKAPTSGKFSANVTFELPAADGTSGQVLKTDGAGILSWVDQDSPVRPPINVSTTATDSLPKPASVNVLEIVQIINSSSNGTWSLPQISTSATINGDDGFKYNIKNIGTGTITIQADAEAYIDHSGQTTITLNQYDSYTLVALGINWYII